MHGTPPAPPTDATARALQFVHGLLTRPAADPPALRGLLAELAGAFGVAEAGLAGLPEGTPLFAPKGARPPWQDDPDLLAQACRARAPLTVERPGAGAFLLTAVAGPEGGGWLLWLRGGARAGWTDGEAAALTLAGQALARGAGPRWAEQLDRAARQRRLETAAQVTRRLAHDFGNVLTGILGFTELALAQQVPAGTPLHSYLSEVYRGAQAGAQFTHQLRLFSRRPAAATRSCALAPVLAEEVARLRGAGDAGLSLQVRVPDDLPPLALDADGLRQVLAALLDNAREALVGPGTVAVSARAAALAEDDCLGVYGAVAPGPHVEVCVADTGAGLSPEVQRRLFAEPFFTTKPRRRGVGLAVAYGVLNAHRAGLALHAGERGVVARVLVPAAPAPAPREAAPNGSAAGASKERVLVVDDDVSVLNMVATTLIGAGYRVEAVSSAEDALRSYAAQQADPFRLVLSDVIMPQVNGVDLASRLLKHDTNVRVLFMSGQVSPDFTQHDFGGRPIELLPKPFQPDGLLRAVRGALDRVLPR